MQTTFKIFFSCSFCLSLVLVSGCGNRASLPIEIDEIPVQIVEEQAVPEAAPALPVQIVEEQAVPEAAPALPELTAEERANVDGRIARVGKDTAQQQYLINAHFSNTDENLVIRHLRYFISQGADIHARDNNNATLLHNAAAQGQLEVVKFLVSQGADINARRVANITPLMEAASGLNHAEGNVEVVKFLVSQGADVHAQSARGQTALDVARGRTNAAVVAYLEGLQ